MSMTIFYICTAPAVDQTLVPDDAGKILEELLEAQNESRTLGLALNLRLHDVEAIQKQYSDPRECLLFIIIAFLRVEPRPTWRVIVEALKSPSVNQQALARRVEAAHFPDSTATHVPPTDSGESFMKKSCVFSQLHKKRLMCSRPGPLASEVRPSLLMWSVYTCTCGQCG